MKRYYDSEARRLIYVGSTADASYWDEHWQTDHLAQVVRSGHDSLVVPETLRRLPSGAVVLEGGCGNGRYAYALREAGYRSVGLDFARATLRRVRSVAPDLCLVGGDVFSLPLADASLDGYWSLGVIEHFWDGYADIIREMRRVLRPGGFLFLTHPCVSPLRRFKARGGLYPRWPGGPAPEGFYQFALDAATTKATIESLGFRQVASRPLFGDWGLSEECRLLKPLVDGLARRRSARWARLASGLLNRLALPFASHVQLQIYERLETIASVES